MLEFEEMLVLGASSITTSLQNRFLLIPEPCYLTHTWPHSTKHISVS